MDPKVRHDHNDMEESVFCFIGKKHDLFSIIFSVYLNPCIQGVWSTLLFVFRNLLKLFCTSRSVAKIIIDRGLRELVTVGILNDKSSCS